MASRWVEPAPPPPGDIDFLQGAFVLWVCGGWGGLKGMTPPQQMDRQWVSSVLGAAGDEE